MKQHAQTTKEEEARKGEETTRRESKSIIHHSHILLSLIHIMFTRFLPSLPRYCRFSSSSSVPDLLSSSGRRLWRPLSFINGEFVAQAEGKTFDVVNPASGKVLAAVPRMSAQV